MLLPAIRVSPLSSYIKQQLIVGNAKVFYLSCTRNASGWAINGSEEVDITLQHPLRLCHICNYCFCIFGRLWGNDCDTTACNLVVCWSVILYTWLLCCCFFTQEHYSRLFWYDFKLSVCVFVFMYMSVCVSTI